MSTRTIQVFKSLNISSRSILNYSTSLSRWSAKGQLLPTRYGGKTNITVLQGGGIGPEIMSKTLEVLDAAEAPLSYERLSVVSDEDDEPSMEFENILTSIKRNRVALKANIEIRSKNPYAKSRNVLLRKNLDLYAYVLRCKTYPGLRNRFGKFDVVVVRQNTEGEYLMLEHEPTPVCVESLKIVTRYASERLAKFAFKYAMENDRKLVTVAHSANIQSESEGLFVKAALEVAKNYPDIAVDVTEVRALAVNIIQNPQLFDMILVTNLNGSIISNMLNGMLGGPALSAGTNIGENGLAVFEPGARNKGSSIAGKGIANPIGMINASINLLNYLGYHKTAQMLDHSVVETLVSDKIFTQDLGGRATTEEITANIIRHVRKQLSSKTHVVRQRGENWRSYCQLPEDFNPRTKA